MKGKKLVTITLFNPEGMEGSAIGIEMDTPGFDLNAAKANPNFDPKDIPRDLMIAMSMANCMADALKKEAYIENTMALEKIKQHKDLKKKGNVISFPESESKIKH